MDLLSRVYIGNSHSLHSQGNKYNDPVIVVLCEDFMLYFIQPGWDASIESLLSCNNLLHMFDIRKSHYGVVVDLFPQINDVV